MKLYIPISHSHCGHKIYVNIQASTRQDIRNIYGSHFSIQCPFDYTTYDYSPSDVFAEADSNNALTGGIVGALVGLLGGPIGAIIGAASGATIGGSSDNEDSRRVNLFNNSY